jgi:hypothetical protein
LVDSICVLAENWYLDSCRSVADLDRSRSRSNIFAILARKILAWILDLPASLSFMIAGLLLQVIGRATVEEAEMP